MSLEQIILTAYILQLTATGTLLYWTRDTILFYFCLPLFCATNIINLFQVINYLT